jgi:hypothetical protein
VLSERGDLALTFPQDSAPCLWRIGMTTQDSVDAIELQLSSYLGMELDGSGQPRPLSEETWRQRRIAAEMNSATKLQ